MPDFPRTGPAALCIVAAILCATASGRAAAEGEPAPAPVASVYQSEGEGRAERIVAASLAGLARHPSISARLRQMARVRNREMVGAGHYVQSGLGEDQRFRFESSLTVGSDSYNLLELCDGLALWSYQKHSHFEPTVNRVDARRVRAKLAEEQSSRLAPSDAITEHLGGIQRTLGLIRESFRFAEVESAEIDGMPIWRIEGRWDREKLSSLVPELKDRFIEGGFPPESLPEGLPWSVALSVGKRELFPFRIEWFAVPGPRPATTGPLERIAVLELYDVRIGEPVDATAFVYKPAEGYGDVTESFVTSVHSLRR